MFCLFFTESPVTDLASAKKSDTAAFARFFHAARQAGIYFAPSQFEAGFISLAHSEEDLRATADFTSSFLRSCFS
jgi:glutamate-1-semialdehyde 2,1-aminomutase